MGLLGTLRFLVEHPLTADRRFHTLVRFLRWQLASRLAPGPIAVDFVASARLLVSRGMTGATGNIYVGLHEFEDMAFLLHLLRPEDLFVDVGANVGAYTILAGAVVGARCIALEPVPKAFERLQDNVRLNGVGARVQAYPIGAGDRRGQLRFTVGLDTVNHVVEPTSSEASEPAVTVDVVPLDELLRGAGPVTLIKLDVEGFEAKVLEGAEQTLEHSELKAVILETNGSGARYGIDDDKLHESMRRHGFAAYRYAPLERRLEISGGGNRGGNSLYLRDPDWVRTRVTSAPRFSVQGRLV